MDASVHGRQRAKPRRSFRGVGLALLCLAMGWAAWQIIRDTISTSRTNADPESAVAWREDSPDALIALAAKRLTDAKVEQDLRDAETLARRALVASPLAEPAMRLLGIATDLRGDTAAALPIVTLAGERSLHDTEAQIWLVNATIRAGQFQRALPYADVILRTRSEISDNLLPAMAAIASDDAGRADLVSLLRRNPPWRGWLLNRLPGSAGPSIAYAVLVDLESKPGELRDTEIKPFLDQLVSVANFDLAYLAWLEFFPNDQPAGTNLIFNGDFDSAPTNIAFDWILSDVAGAATEVTTSDDADRGSALRVSFSNTRVAYSHTSKLLLLPPGEYTLSGLVSADGLMTVRGMVWRVYCAEGDKQLIGETPRISGTFKWQSFAADFTVPAAKCHAQWLRLENAARVAIEQQISGVVWYDHMAIAARAGATSEN